MEKRFIWLLAVFFIFTISFASSAFGDIDVGENNTPSSVSDDEVEASVESDEVSESTTGSRDKGVAETVFTKELYIALGLGAFVLLIFFYFIYRMVVGPSVRWKKPKLVNI